MRRQHKKNVKKVPSWIHLLQKPALPSQGVQPLSFSAVILVVEFQDLIIIFLSIFEALFINTAFPHIVSAETFLNLDIVETFIYIGSCGNMSIVKK